MVIQLWLDNVQSFRSAGKPLAHRLSLLIAYGHYGHTRRMLVTLHLRMLTHVISTAAFQSLYLQRG
jgi:hypothetical protein